MATILLVLHKTHDYKHMATQSHQPSGNARDSGVVGVGSGVVASIRNDPLVQVVQLVWK